MAVAELEKISGFNSFIVVNTLLIGTKMVETLHHFKGMNKNQISKSSLMTIDIVIKQITLFEMSNTRIFLSNRRWLTYGTTFTSFDEQIEYDNTKETF